MQNDGLTMEVVVFRPKAGVDLKAMRAASRALDPVLKTLPGFISRHSGEHQDGRWVDVLLWRSMADAKGAMEKVHEAPQCQTFFAFIDPSHDQLDHYAVTGTVN